MVKRLKFLEDFRCRIGRVSRKYPAGMILLGLIAGSLPVIMSPENLRPALWIIIISALMALLLLKPGNAGKFIFFAVAGFILAWVHIPSSPAQSPVIFSRPHCGATVTVKVDDSSVPGKLDWLPNPKLVKCKLINYQLTAESAQTDLEVKIAVHLPDDFPQLGYGDIIKCEGVFVEPSAPPFPGGFNLKRYLQVKGIKRIFYAREAKRVDTGNGIYRFVLKTRNRAMGVVTSGIDSMENRKLLAALLFGCRQGLSWENRQSYLRSGTIHIFTVSGLHVGVFALILFLLLRGLPFRVRHLLIPGLILIYVITTGMNPPAVRAWLMISIWCICRADLFSTPPLNVVFVSASILLIFNPYYQIDAGFQFSFLVVGFLLLSGHFLHSWLTHIREILDWKPNRITTWKDYAKVRFIKWLVYGLLGCVVAWLASSGVILYYQGWYLPVSILANFLLIPLVWFMFIIAILKLLLAPLLILTPVFALIITAALGLMNLICSGFGSLAAGRIIASPPLWSLVVFYLAFLLMFRGKSKRGFLLASLTVILILGFWQVRNSVMPDRIAIFHGGRSQQPAIVICRPSAHRAAIINVPSSETAQYISNYLICNGVNRITLLAAQGPQKDYCAGMEKLVSAMSVDQLLVPKISGRTKYAENARKTAISSGTALFPPSALDWRQGLWHFTSGNMRISAGRNECRIVFKTPEFATRIDLTGNNLGTRKLEISINGKNVERIKLQNCNSIEFKEIINGP